MRLSQAHREVIVATVAECLGAQARATLFGSRTNDNARGGDIDLLVEAPHMPANPPWTASLLEARLQRRLQGRKVDVVLLAPGCDQQPIHRIARSEGIPL